MRKIPDGWVGANMAMHDKYKNKIKLADQVNFTVSFLSQMKKIEVILSKAEVFRLCQDL